MMRMILACALALATGACAVVGSETPLFSAADARGQPVLRAGVWAMPVEECSFQPTGDPARWPSCANATLVSREAFTELRSEAGARPDRMRYVLAAGDPRILQVQAPNGETDPAYVYAGLRPLRTDAKGRITEARVWMALCEQPRKGDGLSGPLPPGLTRREGAKSCSATDQQAARDAVLRTEGWLEDADMAVVARWLRDVP